MPRLVHQTPRYRRHKATGQAVVTLDGRDFYLGPHGTRASKAEYDRVVGEWLAAGRCLPRSGAASDVTVAEIAAAYRRYAEGYYRDPDGLPTQSIDRVHLALRILRKTYADTRACDFGPLSLQAIQHKLAAKGKSRGYINDIAEQIKRMFKWAVAQELLPVVVFQGLQAVAGLKRGRTDAREPDAVQPVDDAVVEATLPHLPEPFRSMVQIQRLTGCRPGEVCLLRPGEIDRSGDVWKFTPASHKTAYRGKRRVIFLGPKAQAALLPWLLRAPSDYCFAPAERVDKWNAQRRAERQSPMTPSQARRRRKRRPLTTPGDRYTTMSYTQAVRRAIAAVNRERRKKQEALLPHWTPAQLRHTAATEIRKQFGGLEPVAAVLGHSHMNVSEIYAEKNMDLAAEIMRKIG